MNFSTSPCCRICGESVNPKDPKVISSKQKKPGGTVYLHQECYRKEQKSQEVQKSDRA